MAVMAEKPAGDTTIRPFTIETPEADLDDLRARIAATHWPTKELVDDRSQGVQLATMRELARYWTTEYDWRKCEARLNALPQFTTEIDGVDIHFIHVRSPHEDALPLIMTHGWPGSVVELLETVGPLTDPTAHGGDAEDAFHLVLPSIPGYGFSGEPAELGWDAARIGQAWAELMRRIGYTRYVAQGGDRGAVITDAMARQAPEGLLGVHINVLTAVVVPGVAEQLPGESEKERAAFDALNTFTTDGSGYFLEMATRPQTIGYALLDSPVALAAWMLDHDTDGYYKIAGAFVDGRPTGNLTKEHIVDNVTLYWLTGTGASAARDYWEDGRARARFAASPLRRRPCRSASRRSPRRSGLPRGAGSRWPTPPSAISTKSTGAATSPPGRSRSSSPPRSERRSGASLGERLPVCTAVLGGATGWLNSEPLGPAELRGHVVLVNLCRRIAALLSAAAGRLRSAMPMESRVPGPGRHSGLRGRGSECALLDDLVAAVRRGESRSLVLKGEAGIGKTALLEYLIASASDLTVVRAVGVQSDMELAFASLHQLCGPLLDRLETLPAPQRQAMEIVFGLSAGEAPDRFLVGLAVLSLFSEAAEQRPLLCVVDDAQWLDQASALTLAFVARRLLAEPVGIVFAAREPGEELRHVSELEVSGVRNGDARALLSSAVRFKLDERVRDRIIAETRGNPLALLELPRGLTARQLAGGFGLVEAQGLAGRIEESFVRRVETLSDDARRLLLIAAAEPVGDPLLLLAASERLGIALSATDAETDALLALGERVTFRHPLVRSAVYRTATREQRREVHLALAEATDRTVDPDRRAWHLATAAAGPDEPVAAELEQSASRAQARGGLAAAAAFLHRSVVLSGDPEQRVRRALAAAQASLHAGMFEGALELLALAEASTPDELQAAHVELLRGQIAFASSMGPTAPPLLLKAAQRP